MDERFHALAEQLLLIERELRVLGMWSATPPTQEALASCEPFCVDTLAFEEWLQWIFLPRMKVILESDVVLPATSGILVMAELVYRDRQPPAHGLLELLGGFDRLICGGE
ncbi:MAG: YqcC family protein [Pseudomonas sp.]